MSATVTAGKRHSRLLCTFNLMATYVGAHAVGHNVYIYGLLKNREVSQKKKYKYNLSLVLSEFRVFYNY